MPGPPGYGLRQARDASPQAGEPEHATEKDSPERRLFAGCCVRLPVLALNADLLFMRAMKISDGMARCRRLLLAAGAVSVMILAGCTVSTGGSSSPPPAGSTTQP